jgi:O-methyltransferase involved in polyketide biosynthesis
VERISPTAHYTGHVWRRNGLSHSAFATRQGKLMFGALEPAMRVRRLTGRPTLEDYLVARHRTLDEMLSDVIEHRDVSQVLELAAGLSPRGWRFTERYGDSLAYLETDLGPMASRKRAALERLGERPAGHRVAELDALRTGGPASLAAVVADLDPERGLAVVSEGLLAYLSPSAVADLWGRLARALRMFAAGHYLFDLGVGSAMTDTTARAFRHALGAFVRGRVHEHFPADDAAVAAVREAGFGEADISRPDSSEPTRLPRLGHGRVR